MHGSFIATHSFRNLSFGLVLVEKSENDPSLGFGEGIGTTHFLAKLMSGAVCAWNRDGPGQRRTHVVRFYRGMREIVVLQQFYADVMYAIGGF